jgi:diguanylate cyclase (GGDEF)-like protein/PAS domain S-box-containing protein
MASFAALAFGRNWLSLSAILLIWATLRFNWFGFCLALAITTLFVAPNPLPAVQITGQEPGLKYWVLSNFELIVWFGISSTCLYLASLLADKRRIEKNLEARVIERTEELDLANRELQLEIDTRHSIEVNLKKTNKRYRALIETAGIPVIVINENYLIEHWNGSAEATSGHRYESVLGRDFLRLCIPSEEHEALIWRLKKASASNTNQENVETSLLTSSGTELSMLWNINHISDEELEEHGQFLLIGQDISSIRKTQDQLHYLAHFDSLTGAANRRLFEDRCRQSIETAKRYDSCLALLSIDIDHFKKINDTLGHDGGDEFLMELVKRFQQSVRKEDTIARLGGDEFAILLPNVSGQEGAEVVARNILDSITKPVDIKGNELIITSSIGITLCPDDGSSYEQLLKNADMAMYRAKNCGRNNIQFYCEDMNKEMVHQIEVEKELRVALKENQFSLHYQPIIDTKSGEIIALEALTRWNHPEKGIIMPDEFINIADQTGLLQQIGEWSINQLCIEGRILTERHVQELPIAFNLTRRQYNHPSLLQMLSDACETHRFNPKKLILEISESTLIQAGDDTLKILRKLKSFGCLIAIDSFGTGSSSLNQLNTLPIDIIKIDRSLVTSCMANKQHQIIVETLLAIAKQLGIKTFASGVETPAQEAFLQKNKCHFVQGFLYSQALPMGPLIAFLTNSEAQGDLHSGDQITLPFGQELL